MPDYKQGKIYKIVCNVTGSVYIGSTIQSLSMRLTGHRKNYKRFKGGKSSCCTSYQIIEQGNYDIVLIENCPCESKDELHRRERHFIESLKCVNKQLPTRTPKEYYQDVKERVKDYYEANQVHILEVHKQYYINNKKAMNEKHRKYHHDNRDTILERQRRRQLRLKTENAILP